MNRRASPPRVGVAGALLLLAALAPHAHAQSPDTRADALYREGTALLEAGRVAEACTRLAESHALDPATGTLLALARCYEREGKIASAWSAYLDAEARARRQGQADRESAARAQASALAARLPRLTIALGPGLAALPGLEVVRDGRTLGLAIVGTAVPVDPGEHVVELRAPGRVGDRRTVRLAEGEARTVSFDALAMKPEEARPVNVAPTPTVITPPPVEGLSTLQITGLVLGGAGVVSLGVASAFGVVAMGANDDATSACASFREGLGGTETAYADCTASSADAASAADLSTVLFIAGGVLAAAGVTLVLVGGDSSGGDTARVELVPGPGGAALRGAL